MATNTEIANLALMVMGVAPDLIAVETDIKESNAAKALWAAFPTARDATLRRSLWNFAKARVSLGATTPAPAFGFGNRYPLPTDCLRVWRVGEPEDRRAPWEVEGGELLTDLGAPLKLKYVRRVTNAELFDPLFVDAMAAKLAEMTAYHITGELTKQKAAATEFTSRLRIAKTVDAQEHGTEPRDEGEFMAARRTGTHVPH